MTNKLASKIQTIRKSQQTKRKQNARTTIYQSLNYKDEPYCNSKQTNKQNHFPQERKKQKGIKEKVE